VAGKNPKAFYNWLSLTGFIVTANSLILILVLYLFSFFTNDSATDLGVYIYIILPAFLVLGLILIPVGVLLAIRKRKTIYHERDSWPVVDLNKREDWATVVKIFLITSIFILASAMGSYRAFEYTESVEFCGKLCHQVEEPEYVTYKHSSHARVTCVECHVGPGTDWYVRSKLSGLYQVYSTLFKKYPRPIETPIHSMRPERETCEQCHWPEKFYSRKLRVQRSYLADSANTEWNLSLLMKIGPEFSPMGLTEGIHWHINKNFRIEYISDSRNRESIPWVKLTNLKTGEVKVFTDKENPLIKNGTGTREIRTMDCLDCHNRASHLFRSAPDYVDNAFVAGLIPKDIAFLKKASMEALKNSFPNRETAMNDIRQTILNYYKSEHPEILKNQEKQIQKAIISLQDAYKLNAFPDMRADAGKFPNHIGHMESEGCFRCHSGRHITANGETISHNCEICHTIIAQGPTTKITNAYLNLTLEFVHPVDIGEKWKTKLCSECHNQLYE